MRKTGVPRILILKGGLEAWKAEGFPLDKDFADPILELKRLGVEMFPPPWTASDEQIVPTLG
jgi:3-mercaptopyruvate sulfurtransferase SseA